MGVIHETKANSAPTKLELELGLSLTKWIDMIEVLRVSEGIFMGVKQLYQGCFKVIHYFFCHFFNIIYILFIYSPSKQWHGTNEEVVQCRPMSYNVT